MKKLLLSSVALIGLTVGAGAADLPRRAAAPVFAPIPVFTWTGFYVGVNAGYGFADDEDEAISFPAGTFPVPNAAVAGTFAFDSGDNEGFVGGAQIGFNYQTGAFVFGVEADIQYADIGGGSRGFVFTQTAGPAFAGPFPAVVRGINEIEYFGTVRGRLGVAFDRALIYATGGFAYASGGDDNGRCFGGFCNDDDFQTGWTVGGGLEYAFTNNLTVKLEGLYVDLDRDNNRGNGYDVTTNTLFVGNNRDNETDFFVVRAGVNFKFGG